MGVAPVPARPSMVPARSPAQRVGQVLSSPGRPLRPDLRSSMGEAFGADFSAVRIHDGPDAADSARAVGASMYTSGTHVVVGDAHAGFDSLSGRRALAHELFHVMQQSEGPVAGTPAGGGLAISDPSDPCERAAQRAAEHIGSSPGPPARPGNPLPEIPHAPAAAARDVSAIPVQRDTTKTNDGVTYETATFDTNKERPSKVSGPVNIVPTEGRGRTAQPIAGALPKGFHGGHVLGLNLGGANIPENVVAMYPGFNIGPWKNVESALKKDADPTVSSNFAVEITLAYPDATAATPDSLNATATYKSLTGAKVGKSYGKKSQPGDIPVTQPPDPATANMLNATSGSEANTFNDAVTNLAQEDLPSSAYLKKNGHLPPPSARKKASYPDKPAHRPYEYLDILTWAKKINPQAQFSDFTEFSAAQRELLLKANMAKNGGVLKSDDPNDPQQNLSEQGAANDPEIDHIIPMSAGGSNWFSNARVISWELNNSLARIKDITGLIDTSQLAPPIFPTGSTWEEKMDEFLPRYLPRLKGQFDVQDIVTVLTTSYNVTVKKKALGAINTVLGKLVAAGDLTLTAGKYRAAR